MKNLTAFNNSRDYNYSWTGDSTTWAPWQTGDITAVPTPSVTISPSPVVEPFIFELYPAIPMILPVIDLDKIIPYVESIKEKEKKKKFLRLIRPIKE